MAKSKYASTTPERMIILLRKIHLSLGKQLETAKGMEKPVWQIEYIRQEMRDCQDTISMIRSIQYERITGAADTLPKLPEV